MAFVPLLSLLVAPLSFDLQVSRLEGAPITLTSPSRNLTLSLHSGSLYADSVAVSPLVANETTTFSVRCISQISLHIASPHANSLVYSPSLCSSSHAGLHIDESALKGCIFDVTQASKRILQRSCGREDRETARNVHDYNQGPIYVAEPLEVNEGGSVPIQWKNVYFMPNNATVDVSHTDVIFTIVEGAEHGELRVDDVVTSSFNYAQILARRVVYKHDGSESHADSVSFQVEITSKSREIAAIGSKTFTLKVKVNSVNDAPELSKRSRNELLLVAAGGSRVLRTEDFMLTDVDDGPDKVRLQVVETKGVHVAVHGQRVSEFSQRQLINEEVSIVDESVLEHGQIKLLARDGESRSSLLTLETRSSKVDVKLVLNTGVRLLHHSHVLITSRNLSFEASIREVEVSYRIVDLPDTGVVECSDDEGAFQMCTSFTQSDINEERVRFRHTSVSSSHHDIFSFQVEAGEFASMVHVFRIDFIPMNIKVFTREPFVLNGTENSTIHRENLFSWTFPKSFSSHNLVYHIDEPPKLGTLSRQLGPNKFRRIGVSSNFTQQDIDERLISYKLHYRQFSIVNDFFVFRVVSPSVSSTLLRFDIAYIPRESSVQLVNKTVVVKEGESASITSDFLSLTTPDDSSFYFRVTAPPMHGVLKLRGKDRPTELRKEMNFTTEDVNNKRLFYENNGGESRTDECRMLAVSRRDPHRQMPLILNIFIILLNENPPRLARNVTVYIVERGERVLQSFLLPWVDDDVDSPALLFSFVQPNKDAAILSTVSPYLPLTSFNQNDIDDGRVMLRHLGHHPNFTINYSVSDGVHTVDGLIHVAAAEPNAWVESSTVQVACNVSQQTILRLHPANFSVATNLDVRLSDIVFYSNATRFSLGTTRKRVQMFTQEDIEKGLVYFTSQGEPRDEELRVNVADRKLQIKLKVECDTRENKSDWNQHKVLRVPVGGAVLLDDFSDGYNYEPDVDDDRVYFDVTRHPTYGYLTLDHEKSFSSRVSRFSRRDVLMSRVQYVHNAVAAANDSMQLVVTIVQRNFSYQVAVDVDVFERNITVQTGTLIVASASRSPLTAAVINVTTSDDEESIVQLISIPSFGWITTSNEKANVTSLSSFTTKELAESRVWYVSDVGEHNDSFAVRACVHDTICSEARIVSVHVTRRNDKAPQLVRNEVLRVHGDKALVTNGHLDVEDSDTPTNAIVYLISRPSNGRVVKVDDVDTAVFNFTQSDVDQSSVAFVANNASTPTGGFSFIVTDGLHHTGPEWFSTERSSNSAILETNGRLIASPEGLTVIGAEVLRANFPNTRSDEIIFSITRPPKHGHIEVEGLKSNFFTQTQINRRFVMYSSIGFPLDEWSRRDFFTFRVFRNSSDFPLQYDERFRITTSYAALSEKVLPKFITMQPLIVSKGGSTAFNQSHLDASALAAVVDKEIVMVEIGTEPRMGATKWVDNDRRRMSWAELRSAFFLLYVHSGDESRDDSIVFHVYAARESTRRTSRLRVAVPIQVRAPHDPLVDVVTFATTLSVLNSGATTLLADALLTRHPTVPPQSIVYRVAQRGCNGVSIRVDEREVRQFSQHQVNEGEVTLAHAVSHHAASAFDVLVFNVEGHTRAVVVKIRPLDLALENHTTIYYPQGKTYVVLNRTHLGAFANGDRKKIQYKVTSGPENGTFYWVAGEKEAKNFTQDDIDEGRILYAQLNMHSYQDRFEFSVENAEKDVIRNSSVLKVTPLIDVQPVIVEAETATPLTYSQINASALQDSSPRFFLTSLLKHGRLTFDPTTNYSTYYFTYADIKKGIVHYYAKSTEEEVHESIELEVRADNVQPARFSLPITILRSDVEPFELAPIGTTSVPPILSKFGPFGPNLPVILLVAILLTTLFLMMCRKRKKPKPVPIAETPPRLPPSPRPSMERDSKTDLLGATVFASVKQAEDRVAMQSFNRASQRAQLASAAKPPTPATARRHVTSTLDYAGVAVDAPPPMRLFEQVARSTQPTNHYWV